MRFSVFTASTPEWTPDDAAAALAAQGWDGIEWRITDQDDAAVPGFWSGNRASWPLAGLEASVPEIARITRESGLAFSGIGGYAQAHDHVNVERMLAATAALGAERVRVTMPAVPVARATSYPEVFAATRADLAWVAGRAAEHGVQALVEIHHRTITSSASAAFRLVDGLDPRYVGVIYDIGNLIYEGWEDIPSALQLLGPYLAHVHVKNVAWKPTGAIGVDGRVEWLADWATLREGQADIEALFRALLEHGYDGWVTVEDFSTALPLAERTADNLAYLRGCLERAQAAVTAAGSSAAA